MGLQRLLAKPSMRERLVGLAVFFVAGMFVAWKLHAIPAVEWVVVYQITDFKTWHDFGLFLKQSRSGISPFLACLEVPAQLTFGSPDLVTKYLYRLGFVIAFIVPWLCFARSRVQMWASFALCFLFLSSATKIAVVGGNQQAYDVYFPLAMLLGIACVRLAARANRPAASIRWGVAAGFALTIMELLRPFGIVFLVVLLVFAALLLLPRHTLALGVMLLPILALSGAWHAKLFLLNDGQIIWSNHGGYNLDSGWHVVSEEDQDRLLLKPKEHRDLWDPEFKGTGKFWPLMRPDTELHTINSKILARETTRYIFSHPRSSLDHIYTGLVRLFKPQIVTFSMYGAKELPAELLAERAPKGLDISLYPFAVWIVAAWFFGNALLVPVMLVRTRSFAVFRLPQCMVLVCGTAMTFAFVSTERGEEARFLFSLLPLLATFPSLLAVGPDSDRRNPWSRLTWRKEEGGPVPTESATDSVESA